MSTGMSIGKKSAVGQSKLPKGEFPNNIHIVKGPSASDLTQDRMSSSKTKGGKLFHDMNLSTLPKFKDVPTGSRIELFKAKLKACHVI